MEAWRSATPGCEGRSSQKKPIDMGHLNPGDNHPFSLRRNLVLLVVACVLPAASVSALLLYANFKLERANVEHQTALVAHTVLADLEREIAAMESALKTLATSQELVSGDLAGFHARATQALTSGIVYNYVLTDVKGHQILNTLQPFGAPLPTTGTPAQLATVFARQTTVLTDFFIGPVTRRPAIAMGVPVTVDGGVRYSLNIGLAPDRLSDIVARHPLPSGWLLAVLDSGGTIVARSRDPSRYVGEKAVPELRVAAARGGLHRAVAGFRFGALVCAFGGVEGAVVCHGAQPGRPCAGQG